MYYLERIAVCFFLLIIVSCGDDEIPQELSCAIDDFSSGVMVINEGPFQNGAGSINMIDDALGNISNAYTQNNCDSLLGSIAQSATVLNDRIAVVVNNSNLIKVLSKNTLEQEGEITGLNLPRYLIKGDGDLAYVSQWGADGVSGSVAEVDLSSYEVLRTVSTGSGPEELKMINGKLYVPHAGGFGRDSIVVVLEPSSMTIEKTIETGQNPQSIVADGNYVWVLNNGYNDWLNPDNSKNGSLVRLENDEIIESFDLGIGNTDLARSNGNGTLYWLSTDSVLFYEQNASSPGELTMGFFYDLALDNSTGRLYVCDAADFNSNGSILQLDLIDGSQITEFQVGIIPGEVVFY